MREDIWMPLAETQIGSSRAGYLTRAFCPSGGDFTVMHAI